MKRLSPLPRPDPDELLRRIQAEEDCENRGRLKIFLGYASRAGKSARMFEEAHRRKLRGQDTVIASLQPRGAEDLTAIVRHMEVVPLRDGAVDVEAVLARRPRIAVVDELARDNPPGSRHAHRWQDVEELIEAGISVLGALNLQHVAEQQEQAARVTGKRAAESVPEHFIHSADELEVVDAPAGSGAGLNELREAALLLAAQVVDEQLQRYMDARGIQQSWGTRERILVCLTPRSNARAMLDSAARATSRFHGQLLALTVRHQELDRGAEERMEQCFAYARALGASTHVLEARDAVPAILRFCREHHVTQVFIGHTRQPAWKVWQPNPVDTLIAAAEGMDVRIFPHA